MNKDDFNKTPDDTIKSADEKELNDILKRLSEILDTSVSLQDAIDLAKRKQIEDEKQKATEQVEFSIADDTTPSEESDVIDQIIPAEFNVGEEINKAPDFSDYENFKSEDEPTEKEEDIEEASFIIEEKDEKVKEDKDESVLEFSINPPENNVAENTEENATSKIFDELLACFENRKLPDDFRFSSFQEHTETNEEDTATEETENTEEKNDDTTDAQPEQSVAEENTDEQEQDDIFTPIYHHTPDEEDEMFSQIFYDEKKQRARKERDKKKWQKQAGNSPAFLHNFFDWMEIIVLSSALALLIFTFVMRLAVVDGDSMNNTLHDKELLVISDLMYTPKNNDIIVFNAPSYSDEPIVKRIIATEGQTVDIDFENWIVTVDGEPLEEDYVNRVAGYMNSSDISFPLTVPKGYLFVMGDNRNDSLDSRDSRIGLVDERFILGEVKLRLSPLNKFGKVD